jgi:DnaJ-class molecular chaperone
MGEDLYALLGVTADADPDTLKAAWREAARRLHPDRNPDDPRATERFAQVSNAWTILSDPDKRLVYDRFGIDAIREALVADMAAAIRAESRHRSAPGAPPRRSTPPPRRSAPPPGHAPPRRPSSSAATRPPPIRHAPTTRAADVRAELLLTLREAAAGGPRLVQVPDDALCPACAGTGVRGSGRLCADCGHTGRVTCLRGVSIVVPISVASGRILRFSGEGRAGSDGRRGALVLEVRVRPDPVFRRQGANLYASVVVLPGASHVQAPTLTGTLTVEIPAKFRNNQQVRVPGQGMPGDPPRPAGDLFISLRL